MWLLVMLVTWTNPSNDSVNIEFTRKSFSNERACSKHMNSWILSKVSSDEIKESFGIMQDNYPKDEKSLAILNDVNAEITRFKVKCVEVDESILE